MLGSAVDAAARPPGHHLIPGQVPLDAGPDGNTIIFDGPKGLVVFDTGRHPEHAQAILAYASARRRPIAAIVNSHRHLDHITGNWDIRRAYPEVQIYASGALEGALQTFLKDSRPDADAMLADPKTSAATRDQLLRGRAVIDNPDRIRPNHVIGRSGRMTIAGRTFDIHLARFAATEGDVWLYEPRERLLVSGDLVVGLVPFLDTACADGWADALRELSAIPFRTLIPGHGDPMSRTDFLQWRLAYDNLLSCAKSDARVDQCVSGWMKDAEKFIDARHRSYVSDALPYYINKRLRAPNQQAKYCRPLKAA